MSEAATSTAGEANVSPQSTPPEIPNRKSRGLRIALKTLGALCGLVLVLVVIGFLLPDTYAIEKTVSFDADPVDFHDQVQDLRNWQKWIAWSKEYDPDKYGDVEYEYTGPRIGGEGSVQTWTDPDGGDARLEITESDLVNGIRFKLDFDGTPSRGSIRYAPTEKGTKVTWRLSGSVGNNPIERWKRVLFVNRKIENNYEIGLTRLKEIAEKRAVVRREQQKKAEIAAETNPLPLPMPGGGVPGAGGGRKRPGGGGQFDPQAIVKRMMENDKNKDGKLSKAELPERIREQFDSWDKNKDGLVDEAELKEAVANFQRGRGRKKRPGGAGPGGNRPPRKKRPSTDDAKPPQKTPEKKAPLEAKKP